MVSTKIKMTDKPFRVTHPNGDVVAGFLDLDSAEIDAKARTERALSLGLDIHYDSCVNPRKPHKVSPNIE